MVAEIEAAHALNLRNLVVQKKLEENTGKIAVTGTDKVYTVVRDINDIEKSEKEVKNDEVKVLDFSNDKSLPSGKVISSKTVSYEVVPIGEPKADSFIKQISGEEPIETSGSVILRSAP